VPADGYAISDSLSVSADGADGQREVAGAPAGAVQFSGGPGLLWLVSYQGKLERQPTPSSTDEIDTEPNLMWESLGDGTWPTYAG
jgi:hypothetical protein